MLFSIRGRVELKAKIKKIGIELSDSASDFESQRYSAYSWLKTTFGEIPLTLA